MLLKINPKMSEIVTKSYICDLCSQPKEENQVFSEGNPVGGSPFIRVALGAHICVPCSLKMQQYLLENFNNDL
jgi:hypothetical protein